MAKNTLKKAYGDRALLVVITQNDKTAGLVRKARSLLAADDTLNTDDVWSGLVDSNFVTATDTFQEFVDAGESELSVCEEASTDDAIVAAVRGSAEVATDDESDGEDDVDPTPEPDFPCKDALEYLAKDKEGAQKEPVAQPANEPAPASTKDSGGWNLATPWDHEAHVAFVLIGFVLLLMALALLGISVGLWFMDPGRDSIIYRMTTQRMKRD
ncbi:hypothetical protein HPB50_025370 [Hyalomma asiaticum]|uniref:Uncharacterized protein n=1 Tax=Hyalomma asiaticum TaxID=266040 RepID=A0ACB7SYW4_HYAAI|nr:hypothetical protein HPB50_025370 [Hyalomma asiaticum]